MKSLLIKLTEQIKNNVSYLSDSGYYSRDVFELIQLQKYPFFNVVPAQINTIEITTPERMSIQGIERYIYSVTIQFAVRSLVINTALMGDEIKKIKGLLDLLQDIWTAIKVDRTIGGTVSGLLPGSTANFDIAQDTIDKFYVAVCEITLRFYKDIAL